MLAAHSASVAVLGLLVRFYKAVRARSKDIARPQRRWKVYSDQTTNCVSSRSDSSVGTDLNPPRERPFHKKAQFISTHLCALVMSLNIPLITLVK